MAVPRYRVLTSTGMNVYRFYAQPFVLKRSFVERMVEFSNDLPALIKKYSDPNRAPNLARYEADTVVAVCFRGTETFAIVVDR